MSQINDLLPFYTQDNLSSGHKQIPNMKDYDIQDQIGSGTYGEVWLAHHKTQDKTLVIKEMSKNKSTKEVVLGEIQALQKLKPHCHKYVLCYDTSFETQDNYYIISEFLGNFIPLIKILETFTLLAPPIQYHIITSLIKGLYYIHKEGVVHRDIKSENIMINLKTHQIKYIDFGFACQTLPCSLPNLAGTRDYMAPEIFMDPEATYTLEDLKAIDVWALGIVIYELIAGDLPLFFWFDDHPEYSSLDRTILHMVHLNEWGFPESSGRLGKGDQKMINFTRDYRRNVANGGLNIDLTAMLNKDPKQRPKI